MIIYGQDFGTMVNTDTCIISAHEHRIKTDDYEYFIIAESAAKRYNLTRCEDARAARVLMDKIAVANMGGVKAVTLTNGGFIPTIAKADKTLEIIADALENIDAALERAFPERSNRQAFTGARRFTSFQDQTEESTKE